MKNPAILVHHSRRRRRQASMLPITIVLMSCLPAAWTFTVTTFNMLAPVHRSVDKHHRESERDEWWRPRAEAISDFVATNMASSDVILLQEWWFQQDFVDIFHERTGHLFDRVAERRPSIPGLPPREDGMAVLIKKSGKLEVLESQKVLTGPQRIAQLVHCRERGSDGRSVRIANTHLSFPGNANPLANDRKQAYEVLRVVRALEKTQFDSDVDLDEAAPARLELIGGDFNSDSCGLAAEKLENYPPGFVNCASASAEQKLTSAGGKVNLGVTHCTHRGEHVSVDHIFARVVSPQTRTCEPNSALSLGYLDVEGTRITDCYRGDLDINGKSVISDHRPVTATFAWPRANDGKYVFAMPAKTGRFYQDSVVSQPLDPLEPPSYMGMLDANNASGFVSAQR